MPFQTGNQKTVQAAVGQIRRLRQEVVERIARLTRAAAKGSTKDTIVEVLAFLDETTIEYFGAEERAMLISDYPDYFTHRNAHSTFVVRVAELARQFQQGGATPLVAGSLQAFLADWTKQHLDRDDAALCDYLSAGAALNEPAAANGSALARPPAPQPAAPKGPEGPVPARPANASTPSAHATHTRHLAIGLPAKNEHRGLPVTQVLQKLQLLSAADAAGAEAEASGNPGRLTQHLLRNGLVKATDLCAAWSMQSGLPMVEVSHLQAPQSGNLGVPLLTMMRWHCLVFDKTANSLCIAVAFPLPPSAVRDIEEHVQRRVLQYLAPDDVISNLLHNVEPRQSRKERQHARHKLSVPIHYYFCNEKGEPALGLEFSGKTADIGEGGLKLKGPAVPNYEPKQLLRARLRLRISLAVPPHTVEAICSPRFIELSPEEGQWYFGMEFVEMDDESRQRLLQICIRAGLWEGLDDKQDFRAYRSGTRRPFA